MHAAYAPRNVFICAGSDCLDQGCARLRTECDSMLLTHARGIRRCGPAPHACTRLRARQIHTDLRARTRMHRPTNASTHVRARAHTRTRTHTHTHPHDLLRTTLPAGGRIGRACAARARRDDHRTVRHQPTSAPRLRQSRPRADCGVAPLHVCWLGLRRLLHHRHNVRTEQVRPDGCMRTFALRPSLLHANAVSGRRSRGIHCVLRQAPRRGS